MKNPQPLVTIITITFNLKKSGREKYFRQCLESVHAQTYKNIEHLVVDGASKDGSLKLIEEYAKKGWISYISESDKGIYDAMNKGIKRAKGEYICFLNSDDFFHNKKAVELSVKALEESGADYSFADTRAVNGDTGEFIGIWKGNINLIPFAVHYCHQSMFTKTATLKELGCFDLKNKVSADSDLMIKLIAKGKKYVYLEEPIVSYRSGGLSMQHDLQSRKEHSDAFYKYLGKKEGLTREDCYLLWNFSILTDKNIFYGIYFGTKLKNEAWRREYYKRLYSWQNYKNQIKRTIPWPIRKPLVIFYKTLKGKR